MSLSRREMLKLGLGLSGAILASNLPALAQEASPERGVELPSSFPLFFPDRGNEQLGYHLEGPLQEMWRAHSHGLVLGSPISEAMPQDDGSLIQYFESGGLRLDPESGEMSFLPLGRQFLEASGDTYNDFLVSPEEAAEVEMVNRHFVNFHGGTPAYGAPLTRPIPLQTNSKDRMQIFENLVLIEYDQITVPAEFDYTYRYYYRPKKQLEWDQGRSPLLWPGETLNLPIAQLLKDNGFISATGSTRRAEAVPYQRDLWRGSQMIIVNTDYYGQRLLAIEGDLIVMEIPISSGRDNGGYYTPATPPEGTRISEWLSKIDYRSPFPDDPYVVPGVPWNMRLAYNPSVFIHGIYWHPNLGRQASHGCVNCTPLHAHWLYNWTTPETIVHARQDIDTSYGKVSTANLRRLQEPYIPANWG